MFTTETGLAQVRQLGVLSNDRVTVANNDHKVGEASEATPKTSPQVWTQQVRVVQRWRQAGWQESRWVLPAETDY